MTDHHRDTPDRNSRATLNTKQLIALGTVLTGLLGGYAAVTGRSIKAGSESPEQAVQEQLVQQNVRDLADIRKRLEDQDRVVRQLQQQTERLKGQVCELDHKAGFGCPDYYEDRH